MPGYFKHPDTSGVPDAFDNFLCAVDAVNLPHPFSGRNIQVALLLALCQLLLECLLLLLLQASHPPEGLYWQNAQNVCPTYRSEDP